MTITLWSVPREKKGVKEKIMRNCIKIIKRETDRKPKTETENALEDSFIKHSISLSFS